ncbi:MAG: hypothetical protein A2Y15_01795 [Clostridiales bacterium GWF2_36_10]|nr:MAG: hypothetical protein A2Y15_01795 [Clostridiales bacterium GWF2_36_10]
MANKKTHKKNNSLLVFALLLILGAVILFALLIANVLGNSEVNSDIISNTSSAMSLNSENNISEVASQNESVQGTTSQSYEEYIGVDYAIEIDEWEQYICPENDEDYFLLVNKTHSLPSDYVPENLVDAINTRSDRAAEKMIETAEKALQAFLLEGAEYGVTNVTVTSAYRSYFKQETIFNGYVNENLHKYATREECEEYVNTFSARPGESEHQTGLACDMHNLSGASVAFADTIEAKWLAQNAHRFGFILRYPEDKVDITGYQFEPWHFRFVGRTAATEMYQKGLCLEEYLEQLNQN